MRKKCLALAMSAALVFACTAPLCAAASEQGDDSTLGGLLGSLFGDDSGLDSLLGEGGVVSSLLGEDADLNSLLGESSGLSSIFGEDGAAGGLVNSIFGGNLDLGGLLGEASPLNQFLPEGMDVESVVNGLTEQFGDENSDFYQNAEGILNMISGGGEGLDISSIEDIAGLFTGNGMAAEPEEEETDEEGDYEYYPDEDILEAVRTYTFEKNSEFLDEGDVQIFSPCAVKTIKSQDGTVRILGYFLQINYAQDGADLVMVSGAGDVELFTLALNEDGSYTPVEVMSSEDGEDYSASVDEMASQLGLTGDDVNADIFAYSDMSTISSLLQYMDENPEVEHIEYVGEMLTAEELEEKLTEQLTALYSIVDDVQEEEAASEADAEDTDEDQGEPVPAEGMIYTEIEDGNFVIRIEESDQDNENYWWEYDREGETDPAVVELITDSTMEDGLAYAGSFRAVGEGEAVIRLLHTNGVAPDKYVDYTVLAEDGGITEVTGGSQAYPIDEEEIAQYIEGQWQMEQYPDTFMDVARAQGGGFDIMISDGETPLYMMTMYYDAVHDSFRYADGIWEGDNVPQTDEEGTGYIGIDASSFESDGSLALLWTDDEIPGEVFRFVRVEE